MSVTRSINLRWIHPTLWGIAGFISALTVAVEAGHSQNANSYPVSAPSHLVVVEPTSFKLNSSVNDDSLDSMHQVNSVSQLSDVQPTDWAFQALQSLVERYGCIAGYPNQTYRRNLALTRYEFAAGLNACLDRIRDLIAAGTTDLVTKSDLVTLQILQEQFAAELATIRGRVDTLETRTTQLETTQFSTTTKLSGEVIFGVTGSFGRERATSNANQSESLDESVIFSDRIHLQRTLNLHWLIHNFVRVHFTTKQVPAVKLGILEDGLSWSQLFSIRYAV